VQYGNIWIVLPVYVRKANIHIDVNNIATNVNLIVVILHMCLSDYYKTDIVQVIAF